MSKKATKDGVNFFTACRENTGKSMCDSGDYYGRHYERPPVTEDSPEITWGKGMSATISTPHYLNAGWEIIREHQIAFEEFADLPENENLNWFKLGEAFCENVLKLVPHGRGNICNGENDMSQVFTYQVFTKDEGDEGLYQKDGSVVVFHIHTGCDVRGGYGRPLFCRSLGEYIIPVDRCAEYSVIGGFFVPRNRWCELDEGWQCGYTSCPYAALEKDVEEWHEDTRSIDTVEVTLKTGERVIVEARMPYLGV